MVKVNTNFNKNDKNFFLSSNSGFTLIELMISLVLGLIISAAVMQIYLINAKTSATQKANSDIIDASVFGIPLLENHLRLANLGTADKVTSNEYGAGIIMASKNIENVKIIKGTLNTDISDKLFTKSGDITDKGTDNEWTGVSNVDKASGQLTIQFRAPQKMFDCEGNVALGPRQVTINGVKKTIDGQIVVERYYLRASDNTKPTELSLYCDAGKYITETIDDYTEQGESAIASTILTNKNILKNFGDAGGIIVPNIDYFDILLKTKVSDTEYSYYTVKEYLALKAALPPIVGIKIAGITRSSKGSVGDISNQVDFYNVLGQKVSLKDSSNTNKSFSRAVFEHEIALRNAR